MHVKYFTPFHPRKGSPLHCYWMSCRVPFAPFKTRPPTVKKKLSYRTPQPTPILELTDKSVPPMHLTKHYTFPAWQRPLPGYTMLCGCHLYSNGLHQGTLLKCYRKSVQNLSVVRCLICNPYIFLLSLALSIVLQIRLECVKLKHLVLIAHWLLT